MEISLTEQIAEADRKIAEAESRLTRFDAAFDGVAAEETAAGEHSWRAAVAVNEAQDERDKIKEKLDAEMAGRHDLQVRPSSHRDIPSLTVLYRQNNARLGNTSKPPSRQFRIPSKKWTLRTSASLTRATAATLENKPSVNRPPMTLLLLKGNTKSIVKVPLAYGKMLKLPREISQKQKVRLNRKNARSLKRRTNFGISLEKADRDNPASMPECLHSSKPFNKNNHGSHALSAQLVTTSLCLNQSGRLFWKECLVARLLASLFRPKMT
jgi:hypothetical protein